MVKINWEKFVMHLAMGQFTIDQAFEDVLDKDGNQVYNEWQN